VGISREEVTALVAANRAPTLLDVRSGSEFARGRIPGATHLPFWTLRWRPFASSTPTDTPIVVYCGHGPRAWWAAFRLRRLGFTRVTCLRGHMAGWRRAGMREERTVR
jgi:rhodanese-related sulfurtransferase